MREATYSRILPGRVGRRNPAAVLDDDDLNVMEGTTYSMFVEIYIGSGRPSMVWPVPVDSIDKSQQMSALPNWIYVGDITARTPLEAQEWVWKTMTVKGEDGMTYWK